MSDVQLIEAVKSGNPAVRDLVESGVELNQQDEQGWTPLNWAAGKGDLETVRLLVEKGADVFKVGRDQRTPYLIALAAGHAEVVKLLRAAEETVGGGKNSRPQRDYCRAYVLKDLRQFPGWTESRINWKDADEGGEAEGGDQGLSDEDIVFLHDDSTVTQSMWRDRNIIFNQVSPEWQEFCTNTLNYKVPDDLDLIVSVKGAAPNGAS